MIVILLPSNEFKIKEVDKYLRIVVLEDGETLHNAFFDRDFKI